MTVGVSRDISEDVDGSAFRAVYTVRVADAVHVMHAFQKKPRRSNKTPRREMDVVRPRLRVAQESRRGGAGRRGDTDT